MKRLAKGRLLFMLAVTTLFLAGCGEPFISALQPAGEVAQTQYDLMLLSTFIMVGVIIVVTVIFLIVLFKFRRKDDKIPKQVEGSHKLEIIWTVIPILLLLVLAVPTVAATFDLADVSPMEDKNEEGKTDVTVVNVKANLYWWEFEYPNQGIVTSQELVVPTDEKVYFNLLSTDVKHSFWIPAAGGKLDTNTENTNKFWLEFDSKKADEVGNIFYGKCAELCGPSHALMDFKVKAISKDDFDAWAEDLASMEEAAQPETASAEQGQEIFNQSCIGCHAVTPTGANAVGPNLTTFGDRTHIAGYLEHTEENLKAWIKDPEEFKPGNKMTGQYGDLSDEEIDALTDYLMGLKVED
ncbi:cytochrome c oxidase subunit II [Cytobacillus sp. FSL W7-1323]|uniref:Cytochrome c oxidase subunit 2 n=1 Tax=Cytobacillus kochii TaxID=859143 RepID=A0A248TD47_9BACI|nr:MULTISPECIES: cytochrome c oxidase subunit II [Cytobacillus]ASV66079.1 cytochrome c oxidase subunit II [Cytobacillus kochii]MCA1027645.1 cytochrome c oxidase subunit II [Cytobacillus kochii]MCM3321846.1 cytochrome c oxidase subunit II [Cytobacillus kochii]MCM3343320.1 cytochrome c oxidase subunit II [Cytobacillus kochii]MDM5207150.1 cytochrome c oxidase subunit II [Cytobacillus kochii]